MGLDLGTIVRKDFGFTSIVLILCVCVWVYLCIIWLVEMQLKRQFVEQKQEELQSCSRWNKNHVLRKIDKMKRQKAMYQMKEQDKTPEKQLNEVEIGNIPEKEFRKMIVKMIQDLGKRMEVKIEKMQQMFNKDLEELNNKQTDEQYNNWYEKYTRRNQ